MEIKEFPLLAYKIIIKNNSIFPKKNKIKINKRMKGKEKSTSTKKERM